MKNRGGEGSSISIVKRVREGGSVQETKNDIEGGNVFLLEFGYISFVFVI